MLDTRITKSWIEETPPTSTILIPQGDPLGAITDLRANLTAEDYQSKIDHDEAVRANLKNRGIPQIGRTLQAENFITDYKRIREDDYFDSLVEAVMNAVEHGTKNLSLSGVEISIYHLKNSVMILIEHQGTGFPFERLGRRYYGTVDLDSVFPEHKQKHATSKISRGCGLAYLFNNYMSNNNTAIIYDHEHNPFPVSGCLFRVNFERFDDNGSFRTILEYGGL